MTRYTSATDADRSEMLATIGVSSIEDLFDDKYTEIPGTNPQQYMARYTKVADRRLLPIHDRYMQVLPNIQFAITIDRNHYLATHSSKYSQPQGPDPVWNTANCRNRLFFKIRASILAKRSPKDLRLSTMRRDLGGGRYVTVKTVSSRVYFGGKVWGWPAIGYVLS